MTLLLTLDDGSIQRKLAEAVELAREAVVEDAGADQVGAHVGVEREDAVSASHLFEATVSGYRGWRWSVTVALAGEEEPITISEVVLIPGPEARVAPAWIPWDRRVQAGDLGVGDIFPVEKDDPRLAPGYLASDDPAVEEVAKEVGLGRVHVLSRYGRLDAAARWHSGEFGPRSDMARSAPDVCGSCGFFVPLAGSLSAAFGACTNDISPADGHVVDVGYGCGAHSEIEVEVTSSVPVAELVYDDSLLDFTSPAETPAEPEAAATPEEPETAVTEVETEVPAAEVEAPVVEAEVPVAEAETELPVAETVADVEPEETVEVEIEVAPIVEDAATETSETPEAPVVDESEAPVAEAPESAEVEPEVEPEIVVPAAEAETEAIAEAAAAEPETVEPETVEAETADAETAETDTAATEAAPADEAQVQAESASEHRDA